MASGAVCAPKCNPWYYRRRQGFGNRTEAREVVGWLEKNGLERITSAQPQAGRIETSRIGGPPEFRSNDGYARQYRYRSARSGLRRVDRHESYSGRRTRGPTVPESARRERLYIRRVQQLCRREIPRRVARRGRCSHRGYRRSHDRVLPRIPADSRRESSVRGIGRSQARPCCIFCAVARETGRVVGLRDRSKDLRISARLLGHISCPDYGGYSR